MSNKAYSTNPAAVLRIAFRLDGEWVTCDAIWHEGKRWLVRTWLENPERRIEKPQRIILLENLELTTVVPPDLVTPVSLIVLTPIPESVFDPNKTPQELLPFVVIDYPDVTRAMLSETRH